jgi:hypothetical protein
MFDIRTYRSFALVLALAGQVLAGNPLSYRIPAGESFDLVTRVDADAPVVGPVKATIKSHSQIQAITAAGMKVTQTITAQIPGKPEKQLALGCTISPEGRASEFTGVDMNNPKDALIVKNAAMGLPTLPNEAVQVGSSWDDERPVYLPKMPIPGVPESGRIRNHYTITAIGKCGERDAYTISFKSEEAPGEKLKFEAKGTFTIECGTGRPLAGHIEGTASVRVVIKTFKIPFKAEITQQ